MSEGDVEVQRPWSDRYTMDDLYSPTSLYKARLLVEGGNVEQVGEHRYLVHRAEPYVVVVSEGAPDQPVPWATCSCPNGRKAGGRPSCYHSAAVLALVTGYPIREVEDPKGIPRRRS